MRKVSIQLLFRQPIRQISNIEYCLRNIRQTVLNIVHLANLTFHLKPRCEETLTFGCKFHTALYFHL